MIDENMALHLSLLEDPDAALAYVEILETGCRPALAAKKCGITSARAAAWRAQSAVYDEMCGEAENCGTASIDDTVLAHVRAGAPGWAAASKLLLQRRDRGYSDKQEMTGRDGKDMRVDEIEIVFVDPVPDTDEDPETGE